jgi:CRISPR-associated protein Cmr2
MNLWKKKLAAWLHDPAEKALVLMRDVDNKGQRIGHEDGSVAELRHQLGIKKPDFDKLPDHYAAAADRPNWPCEDGKPRPAWANVRFVETPVLIHPLSGEEIALGKLTDIAGPHIRHVSLDHFQSLIETDATGAPDHRWTQLAFWRFGPEPQLVSPELGELWRLLPADTRVPDHTIWSHLDIVSALAGAMADDQPALLTMSFGPVQGFIAQARSTSDLWAGSHLLSSLVWQGLKVICEALGPDAVLFPHLRGVATVDRWLLESVPEQRRAAWKQRFQAIHVEWLNSVSDANPLFAATLPNKFMAIVPASRAKALAQAVTDAVREAALTWAVEAGRQVFDAASGDTSDSAHWRKQIAAQLNGFPEVHWSVAAWPLETDVNGFPVPDDLEKALAAYYPVADAAPGFFADPLWKLVANADVVQRVGKKRVFRNLKLSTGESFFVPNPGLLYPAVHELAERSLAAAKSLRAFAALPQTGYRCTLTGEHEWLTDDPDLFSRAYVAQKEQSAWTRVVGQFGIKAGEHLGALATLKRLWPTLFVEQVKAFLDAKPDRFIISTHTMALASSMGHLLDKPDPALLQKLSQFSRDHNLAQHEPVTLPKSLHERARMAGGDNVAFALKRIPAALDAAHGDGEDGENRLLTRQLEALLGAKPETYYALIQMDGDRMGAWMAGNEDEYRRTFADTWHPQVRASVRQQFGHEPDIANYLKSYRPASPARHAAISKVLNDFSTHVARHIVEDVFKGKLIYAGGDDVLAMVSLDDLLPAMLLLRAAYSGLGSMEGVPGDVDLKGLQLGKGFVHLKGRLMLMMGSAATASMGAIVAHHQAPLSAVLRQLRSAEKKAKDHGRNAFCLRVMKRGGGEVSVTSKFWPQASSPPPLSETALGLMLRFAQTLAQPGVSRRAVYNTTEWLAGLPERPAPDAVAQDQTWQQMVATNLAFQLQKQGGVTHHAAEFVALACRESSQPAETARVLENLLLTSEFFAREGRAFSQDT